VPRGKAEIKRKFPKIAIQYFMTTEELLNNTHFGHWTSYITLLKGGRILYTTKGFKKFLKKLKKKNLFEELIDIAGIEYKYQYERKELKKRKGFKAVKWALPSIRKRLQLLTYIRKHKLIWKIGKNIQLNKDILNKEERKFLLNLNKKLKNRSKNFNKKDEKRTIDILNKLNKEIIIKEFTLIK